MQPTTYPLTTAILLLLLKKFSKILKEQGAGPLFTTFKGYVTYALYDRWKVRRLRKFPPRMVKNRILFETNDDFTDNCRALFDYMVANGYNKKYELVWLVHEPEKYKKYQAENVCSQFQEEHDDPQGSSLPLCIDFSLYFLHPGV